MDAIVVIFFLGVLHGFGKALRDTVAHHFLRSIFATATGRTWVWMRSHWRDKPAHWIAPLWDAWHFGDFLTSLSPTLAMLIIVFYRLEWQAVAFYLASAGFVFFGLYKFFFIFKLSKINLSRTQ